MILIVVKTPILPTLLAGVPEIVNVEVPGGWSRMAEVEDAIGS